MNEYSTIGELATALNVNERTIRNRMRAMSAHIGKEYPESALMKDGKVVRVRTESFFHFCNHRKEMRA